MSDFIEVVHEYLYLFAYLAVYFLEALSLFFVLYAVQFKVWSSPSTKIKTLRNLY